MNENKAMTAITVEEYEEYQKLKNTINLLDYLKENLIINEYIQFGVDIMRPEIMEIRLVNYDDLAGKKMINVNIAKKYVSNENVINMIMRAKKSM